MPFHTFGQSPSVETSLYTVSILNSRSALCSYQLFHCSIVYCSSCYVHRVLFIVLCSWFMVHGSCFILVPLHISIITSSSHTYIFPFPCCSSLFFIPLVHHHNNVYIAYILSSLFHVHDLRPSSSSLFHSSCTSSLRHSLLFIIAIHHRNNESIAYIQSRLICCLFMFVFHVPIALLPCTWQWPATSRVCPFHHVLFRDCA